MNVILILYCFVEVVIGIISSAFYNLSFKYDLKKIKNHVDNFLCDLYLHFSIPAVPALIIYRSMICYLLTLVQLLIQSFNLLGVNLSGGTVPKIIFSLLIMTHSYDPVKQIEMFL